MTAHSSGSGSSWNETLDIDQPHGLDYQEWNDIRIGVRKRESQEHATYADSTVGGIHKPGRSAILEIGDATPPATRDGSYGGHSVLWDNSSRLWCWTAVAGATAAPGVAGTADWTVLTMHPDKQWGGQEITWTGDFQFDSSGQFLDPVDFTGPVTIDGSADVSDVYVDGDMSIKGSLAIATDFTLTGDMGVDGTSNLTGDVAFGADISVDATAVFGAKVAIEGDASGDQFVSAWVSFCADGANGDLGAGDFTGYNINVVEKIATGVYELSFSDALAHADYAVIATVKTTIAGNADRRAGMICVSTNTDSCRVTVRDKGSATGSAVDPTRAYVAIFA